MSIIDFYKHKRTLITGHTGFIGSWLGEWLDLLGSDLCGYALDPPSVPNMYSLLGLGKKINDVRGDLLDTNTLRNTINDFKPEIVFHLAAQPIVLQSYEQPVETFAVNVLGTVKLLDMLRKMESTKVIIVMTSDKVYKNDEDRNNMFRETDPIGGKDPYSASKACQDIVVNSFSESYFSEMDVRVSTIRAGNVIGGGDWGKHRIIPDIVEGITNNQIIKIRNPNSERPWQHVLEPVSVMLKLAQKMWYNKDFAGNWNIGPPNKFDYTVKDLTEKFIECWGSGTYKIYRDSSVKESTILKLDSNKARGKLGLSQIYDYESAVMKTVQWYKAYYNSEDVEKLTKEQIGDYQRSIEDRDERH